MLPDHFKDKTKQQGSGATGFSLVETLVAVSILFLVIASGFTAVYHSIKGSFYARDQVTAYYLAQEAVEFIKNVRAENAEGEDDWLSGLDACKNDGCNIDSIARANGEGGIISDDYQLCISTEPDSGVYRPCAAVSNESGDLDTGWSASAFKREVTITGDDNKEAKVEVEVSWSGGGSVQVETYLFNWR